VQGKIPTSTQLSVGEAAINTFDAKIFIVKDQSSVGIATTVIVVNPWTVGPGTSTYNTYFTSGNVGVGSTIPSFQMDVSGDVRVQSTGKMRFGGNSGTTNFYMQYNSTTNSLDFVAG
jgi:hypothetical protein